MPEGDWMKSDPIMGERFICPGCGSTDMPQCSFVSPAPPRRDDPNPYSGVHYMEACAACLVWIPGHLAERWGGMTVEQAREEWQRDFAGSPYLERYDEREYEEEEEDDDL